MALDATKTAQLTDAHFYFAPVGTALPTDLNAPAAAWVEVGHTSSENALTFSSEGGDKTTLTSFQSDSLRVSRSAKSDTFQLALLQVDDDTLALTFGSNLVDVNSDGSLMGIPGTAVATERAFLAVLKDGNTPFAVYAPKTDVLRSGEGITLGAKQSLAELVIDITPLQHLTNSWTWALTPIA